MIVGPQSLMIEPNGRHISWRETFQYYIRCRGEPTKQCPPILIFKVQGHAAFGGVVVPEGETAVTVRLIVEEWSYSPCSLARRWFDFNHVGTKVGH